MKEFYGVAFYAVEYQNIKRKYAFPKYIYISVNQCLQFIQQNITQKNEILFSIWKPCDPTSSLIIYVCYIFHAFTTDSREIYIS